MSEMKNVDPFEMPEWTREDKILALKAKIARKIARKKRRRSERYTRVEVSYDEVFEEGTAWLDAIARGEIDE